MNTQRRPGLHAGMTPRLARHRTSSGCIFRNAAASRSVSVFIDVVDLGQHVRADRWIVGLSSDCSTSSGLETTLDLIATTIRDDFFQRFVGSSAALTRCGRAPRIPAARGDPETSAVNGLCAVSGRGAGQGRARRLGRHRLAGSATSVLCRTAVGRSALSDSGTRPIGDRRRPDLAASKLPVEHEHRLLAVAHCGGHTSAGHPQDD